MSTQDNCYGMGCPEDKDREGYVPPPPIQPEVVQMTTRELSLRAYVTELVSRGMRIDVAWVTDELEVRGCSMYSIGQALEEAAELPRDCIVNPLYEADECPTVGNIISLVEAEMTGIGREGKLMIVRETVGKKPGWSIVDSEGRYMLPG